MCCGVWGTLSDWDELRLPQVTAQLTADLGEQHVVSAVDHLEPALGKTRIVLNCTVRTTVSQEADLVTKDIETLLGDSLKSLRTVGEDMVTGSNVDIRSYEVVNPPTTTTGIYLSCFFYLSFIYCFRTHILFGPSVA